MITELQGLNVAVLEGINSIQVHFIWLPSITVIEEAVIDAEGIFTFNISIYCISQSRDCGDPPHIWMFSGENCSLTRQ